MKKSVKITSICLIAVFTLIFIALNIYFNGATYKDYYAVATPEFEIPGLDTTFVPQGMTYDNVNNQFLISGYMSDKSPSRIYVVSNDGKNVKHVTLSENQVSYTLHAGGIAINQNSVYVAGDKKVVRVLLSDLLACENEKQINIVDSFETGNGCDFLVNYNNKLIVGEFYKKDKYDTPSSHHIKISETETNYALSFAYSFNPGKQYGLESLVPEYAISMPNQVQGMTFTKQGKIFLSTSYSIADSILLIYNNVLTQETTKTVTVENTEVPVYILDNNNLNTKIKAPSMSEEAILVGEKVYLLFESNCQKYRLINRTKISDVHSINI